MNLPEETKQTVNITNDWKENPLKLRRQVNLQN